MKPLHWYLIGFLLLIIVLMIIFWPSPGPSDSQIQREQAYQTQVAILEVEKRDINARVDSLLKATRNIVKTDSVKLRARDKEINQLKARLSQARPEIQPMLDSIPKLKEFVSRQDSVIFIQDSTIVSLRESLYEIGKNVSLLEDELVKARDIEDRISQECEARKNELLSENQKMEKKYRRKVKVWQVVSVVGFVGAFLLGSK